MVCSAYQNSLFFFHAVDIPSPLNAYALQAKPQFFTNSKNESLRKTFQINRHSQISVWTSCWRKCADLDCCILLPSMPINRPFAILLLAKKSPGPSCGFNRGYMKRLNKYHRFIFIPVFKAFANLSKLFFMISSTHCGSLLKPFLVPIL